MLKDEIAELIADWRMAEAGDRGPDAKARNLRLVMKYPKKHLEAWLNWITAPESEKAEAKKAMNATRPGPGMRGGRSMRRPLSTPAVTR